MIWKLFDFIEIREIDINDFCNKDFFFYKTKMVNYF